MNIIISLGITILLYGEAPEKNDIGFNKYWQTLMMDSYPSADKKLLIYDDKKERYQLFKIHRCVSVIVMGVIVINMLLLILLS